MHEQPQHEWLVDLTDVQSQAVTHEGGPLLVLAGPGSGKTRVITRRIAHRIASGMPAWNILALTFTNKAAAVMKDRVDALVPADAPGRRGLAIGTFHSFCASLLRRYGSRSAWAGLDGKPLEEEFSIFDSDDGRSALKSAMSQANLDPKQWPLAAIASEISAAKNRLKCAKEVSDCAGDFRERTIARVYTLYQKTLVRENALDFDDLLMRTARMLRDDVTLLEELQDRYREVLVDEYQDTNQAQFTVAHSIARAHRAICVVGDPDQSIYAWRGADLSNILEFETHYPGARVIALGENFRSTGHIVALADQLIRHNTNRRHKDLFTALGEGRPVRVARCSEEVAEANFVADALAAAHHEGVQWKDMAVLYRMNALSRTVEDALRRRSIPYIIARGTAFYERREVRDTLSYLRALVNSVDDTSLRRIVNVPPRGIGATSLAKVENVAVLRGLSLGEALARARDAGITERAARSIDGFLLLLARFRSELSVKPAENLGPFVARLIGEAGLERAAAESADDEQEALDRRANVQEVANAAGAFVPMPREPGAPHPTLGDALREFLQSIALASDSDAIDPHLGVVTLMSLHAAKGLEFHTVAIVGLEEGLLPHARSLASPDGIEEERRLFFVGMTRAQRSLIVTSCASRATHGVRMSTIPSGFLRELPSDRLEIIDQARSGWESSDESSSRGSRLEHSPAARGMTVGTTVRHGLFGIGRIEEVLPRGSMTSVTVRFRTAGVRTVVLEYAKLEIVARV